MRKLLIALPLAIGLSGLAAAKPAPTWPQLGVETSIVFPDRTLYNFEPDDDRGVWLEDRQRRWYYASFIGPCQGLNFVHTIGYEMRGSSHLRRSSMILVDDQKCQIDSLVTAEKPLPRKEREKARQTAAAAADQEAPSP